MKVKNKKSYISIVLLLLLISPLMIGCKRINNNTENLENKKTINWIVLRYNPVGGNYENTTRAFNDELKENGYNFQIKIVEIGNSENYYEELNKYLKSGKQADIITFSNCGIDMVENNDVEFFSQGNFISFDNFNKKDVDILLNKGTKIEWDKVKYNGKIYSIPAGFVTTYPEEYYFKNKNIKNTTDNNVDKLVEKEAKEGGFIFTSVPRIEYIGLRTKLVSLNSAIFCDGETGIIENLYNQKNFIDMLKLYNKLYRKGYINDISDIEETLLDGDDKIVFNDIPKDTKLSLTISDNNANSLQYLLSKYKTYSVSLGFVNEKGENSIAVKPFLGSNLLGSTGIYSKSKNPDDAFKLLTLANTEKKYSDILLHGLEGTDYTKKDGIIKDDNTEFIDRLMSFQLYYNVSQIDLSNKLPEDVDYIKSMFKTEKEIQESYLSLSPSPYIGFNFNTKGFEDIITKVNDIAYKNLDIWKSDNLEAELERVRKELSDAGVDKLTEEVRRQVEEWKKIVE